VARSSQQMTGGRTDNAASPGQLAVHGAPTPGRPRLVTRRSLSWQPKIAPSWSKTRGRLLDRTAHDLEPHQSTRGNRGDVAVW